MSTIQGILDHARQPLNDVDKVRYPDLDLLKYANTGLRMLRLKRPDLFFGQYATPFVDLAVTDLLPIDDEYGPALSDFVTAHAETVDDEHVDSGRAAMFFQMAAGAING